MSDSLKRILSIIFKVLGSYSINSEVILDESTVSSITIGSLQLDSLEMLQFVMELETSLDIELELDFPEQTTLLELAMRLEKLIQNKSPNTMKPLS